jgi:hypothetical protein
MHARLLTCFAASLVLAPTLTAQRHHEEDVLDVIAVMFEGLAQRDTAKMRSTLEPGTRLVQTFSREGQAEYRVVPINDLLANIGNQEGPAIEERYRDPKVRVHDNLATVWISYTFYVNEEISHCGEDTFQLARGAEGWKIIAIADTQRRVGCEEGAGEHASGEGAGEHARTEGRGEHDEDGEHHRGEEGEESGEYIGAAETWDKTRKGARLILSFDPASHAFVGTVENTTDATLCAVRVEVHLSSGTELGPTERIDLLAGEQTTVELATDGEAFETWTAHPEVAPCTSMQRRA